jgi:hypothetical protein
MKMKNKTLISLIVIVSLVLTMVYIPFVSSQGLNYADIARYMSDVTLSQNFDNTKLTDISSINFWYRTIGMTYYSRIIIYGTMNNYSFLIDPTTSIWTNLELVDSVKNEASFNGDLNTEYLTGISFEPLEDMTDLQIDDVSIIYLGNEVMENHGFEGEYVHQISIEDWIIYTTGSSIITVYQHTGGFPTVTPTPTATPILTPTVTPTPISNLWLDNIMVLVWLIIIILILFVIYYIYLLLRRKR